MKIGQPADTPALTQSGSTAHNGTHGATAASPAGPTTAIPAKADASAKIELSKAASSLLAGGASNAEFDADKVARISQAIDDGSFKIDPAAIADKLISHAHELLARAQR